MNAKSIIKLVIAIVFGLFVGLVYGVYTIIVALFFPQYEEMLRKIPGYILIALLSIGAVICFVIFFVSFFRELNYIKLYNNELAYKGFTEELYEATLKRKKRFEKNKYSVGYIGSINMIAGYLGMQEKYDEEMAILEEINIDELKKKFKIDSANPSKDNLITFMGFLDTLICVYSETGNREKEENTFEIFNPYYNAFIHKYDYLTNILYEAKLRDLLFHGNFNEALSILDILKGSDKSLYNLSNLDYLYYIKETDIEKIENAYNASVESNENTRLKAYFNQMADLRKNQIYKKLKAEE